MVLTFAHMVWYSVAVVAIHYVLQFRLEQLLVGGLGLYKPCTLNLVFRAVEGREDDLLPHAK